MDKQKVSLGRVVLYHEIDDDNESGRCREPRAAVVARVWDAEAGMVNLTVFEIDGGTRPETSVGKDAPGAMRYWTWPPRV